jgi:hypothetical protein
MFGIDTIFYLLLLGASTAISYDASRDQARAAEQTGFQQKLAADKAAEVATLEAAEASRRARDDKDRKLARIRAGMNQSGLVFEGSLEDVFAETAGRMELEILDASRAKVQEVQNIRGQGELAMWQARTQAVAAHAEGVGTILSGVSSAAGTAYGAYQSGAFGGSRAAAAPAANA